MFRLWGSGSGLEKVASEKAKLAGLKPHRSSVMKDQLDNHMKRKRSDTQESAFQRLELGPAMRWSDQNRGLAGDAPRTQTPFQTPSITEFLREGTNGETMDSGMVQADAAEAIVPTYPGTRVFSCS